MKKQRQCGHPSRKTRSKASQENNHSGQLNATVETSDRTQSYDEQMTKRKPKIRWPKANDKESYQKLENTVCKKMKAVHGSTQEKLVTMANLIYASGEELFGVAAGKKEVKSFVSRRDQKMQKLRKEKKELRKRWLRLAKKKVLRQFTMILRKSVA